MNFDMRSRTAVALRTDTQLMADFGDRVFEYGSVSDTAVRPYLVVKLGIQSPEWRNGPTTRWLQVWAHDDPGDFSRIDRGLERAKAVLQAFHEDECIEVNYADTSQDFEDIALGTICRYSRYTYALSV